MKVKVEVELYEIKCRSCYKTIGFGFSSSTPNLRIFCEKCVKENKFNYVQRERKAVKK